MEFREEEQMRFLTAMHTETGPCREANEDSMLLMRAETQAGEVALACVCDGMGGLERGEAASAAVVCALRDWFTDRFPALIRSSLHEEAVRKQWSALAMEADRRISDYGIGRKIELGTTCAVILLSEQFWFLMNIGDSRIYRITDSICQLTKDQTWVQREYDLGRMSAEQMRRDPRRNLLLQCIGTGAAVQPDYLCGKTAPGQVFLLCSDGFCHEILPHEFLGTLRPGRLTDQKRMKKKLIELTELGLRRGETDNMSAILIRLSG